MKRVRAILAGAILLMATTGTHALPACGNKVMCGATCTYTSVGGQCDGGGPGPNYCYREAVRNDYDTVVFSCQEGSFDYCCIDELAY